MTLTVLQTGGVDYNSYASMDEANEILNVDPKRRGNWIALDDDEKKRGLIAATFRLDLFRWQGDRTGGSSQQNAFPRTGLKDSEGSDIASTAIPDPLARATSLLAGTIAATPGAADQGSSASNISEVKAGPATVKFFRDSNTVRGRPLQDETAYDLIRRWLRSSTSAIVSTAYGADGESEFSQRERYGYTGW